MSIKLPENLIGVKFKADKPKPVRRSLEGVLNSKVDARNYRGNGHWEFPEDLGGKEYVGFIYIIKDIVNNKLYLGKKQYRSTGILTKGEQSNWQWYLSSSKELSESIKTNGKENFKFIAIEQYKTIATLSYSETWSLLHVEAPVHRYVWYNRLINKVSWSVKEEITDRHRDRLTNIIKEVYNV